MVLRGLYYNDDLVIPLAIDSTDMEAWIGVAGVIIKITKYYLGNHILILRNYVLLYFYLLEL